MKFILMDVEGTTTSISFVHDTLFPFSRRELRQYVQQNAETLNVKHAIELTKQTVLQEDQAVLHDVNDVCAKLIHWIDTDRKHPALKALQGDIWETGYKMGEINAHVYEDVPEMLKKWKDSGLTLGVYSSGSVKAQHLLFEFSIAGNLRPYFSNHFDTGVGNKREVSSYKKISDELAISPHDILFLSDIKEELDAARNAGMQTCQLVRRDDVILGDHLQARNFTEVKF